MATFSLLEPSRGLRDEGLLEALRIVGKAVRDGTAGRRVFAMRPVMRQYRHMLAVVATRWVKPELARGSSIQAR